MVDFLHPEKDIDKISGREKTPQKRRQVIWHKPEEEKVGKQKTAKVAAPTEKKALKGLKKQQIKEIPEQDIPGEELQEVEFLKAAPKIYSWKYLKIGLISVIIIIIVGLGGYYVYIYYQAGSQPQPPVSPVNQAVPSEPPEQEPGETDIGELPTENLPPTELAPIRGSLVSFPGTESIYLIDADGSLRLLDKNTVIFDNGDSLNQISQSLIYTLADKWRLIRKGKIVRGRVEYDPRVLAGSELAPFQ